MLSTKITAAQNEAAFSYHRVRELDFVAVIFAATIPTIININKEKRKATLARVKTITNDDYYQVAKHYDYYYRRGKNNCQKI